MKDFVRSTWLKYKKRYDIPILDYIIMDNHCHLLVFVKDTEKFTAFMRAANSVIAKKINSRFEKDSAAIKDRFKSPVIFGEEHLLNTIQYIWHNSVRAKICEKPGNYPWCSLYNRLRGIPDTLLDEYSSVFKAAGFLLDTGRCAQAFAMRLLNKARALVAVVEVFEHSHTIGNVEIIKCRASNIYSARMQQGP